MTHTIADSEHKLQHIYQAWPDADSVTRPDLLDQLKSVLSELWETPGNESLQLRQQIRAFIDEAEHRRGSPS